MESSQIQTDNGQGTEITVLRNAPEILWVSLNCKHKNKEQLIELENEIDIEIEVQRSGVYQKEKCRYELKSVIHNYANNGPVQYGV